MKRVIEPNRDSFVLFFSTQRHCAALCKEWYRLKEHPAKKLPKVTERQPYAQCRMWAISTSASIHLRFPSLLTVTRATITKQSRAEHSTAKPRSNSILFI
jgi:hypothetical protein